MIRGICEGFLGSWRKGLCIRHYLGFFFPSNEQICAFHEDSFPSFIA